MKSGFLVFLGFILFFCLVSPSVTADSTDHITVYVNPAEGIRGSSGTINGIGANQTELTTQSALDTVSADTQGPSGNAWLTATGATVSSAPFPYFPTRTFSIRNSFAPGLIVSSALGIVVVNGGGAGNVYYNISASGFSPRTKTFWMASSASVKVWAEVCSMTTYCPGRTYHLYVRPAQPGDQDVGTVWLEPTPKDQVGVFRPSMHRFYLKNGTENTTITWGQATDIPLSGDWNHDGLWDVGVFHNATRVFILKNGTRNTTVSWGTATDLPVTGDWNRDGFTEVGVFRPVNHKFYLRNGSVPLSYSWGISTDLPVTGDWNGDGFWDVGVFRPSAHMFYLRNGSANTSVSWGISTDLPVTGDWNGDGLWDVGVFRNATHRFYLRNGSANTSVNWGLSGDKPVSGKWR
jgi:hypothetical protein